MPINRAQSRLLDLGAFGRSSATNPDPKPTFPHSTSLLRPTECRLPSQGTLLLDRRWVAFSRPSSAELGRHQGHSQWRPAHWRQSSARHRAFGDRTPLQPGRNDSDQWPGTLPECTRERASQPTRWSTTGGRRFVTGQEHPHSSHLRGVQSSGAGGSLQHLQSCELPGPNQSHHFRRTARLQSGISWHCRPVRLHGDSIPPGPARSQVIF